MNNNLNDNIIEIKNVTFSRGEHLIYKNINLSIKRGSIVAIMGPSGTGKTTLLRLISNQLSPEKGEIFVDGENVVKTNHHQLYQIRKKMGMLFQSSALFSDLSVFDNIAYPLREHSGLPELLIRNIVLMKLEAVGLRGASEMMPNSLSGGMARRVALARAIALDPKIIMFDEPFTGQDPISMAVLVKLIFDLNKSLGITCIIVSHDVKKVMEIADYSYIIGNQTILAEGTTDALNQNKKPEIRQFLDGLADGTVPFHYPAKDYFADLLGKK